VKILILKPSSLGDVVQALPVLRLLKLHFPQSAIYWWIDSRFSPLLEGDPDLAGLFHFERRRWASPLNWMGLWGSLREMRSLKFDWVIDLQSLARSGAFAWLSNGELTLGLDDAREGARGFYDAAIPRRPPGAHAVEWYLDVLRHLGVPVHSRFVWMPERPGARSRVEERWRPGTRRWAALVPGARWINKRWPAAHFGALARELGRARPDLHFVLLGGAEDDEAAREISAWLPERCLNLAGETSLPELVEWIRLSEMVVSNDTGPMHIAAALGKPVWGLFGPTDPGRTGPHGQMGRALRIALPCAPCLSDQCRHRVPMECLRALSPESVAAIILGPGQKLPR
jgi:heptosyltransferase-1